VRRKKKERERMKEEVKEANMEGKLWELVNKKKKNKNE